MKLGVVARADRGGLGQLAVEVVRALQPERVLVIDCGDRGRGPTELSRITEACPSARGWVVPYPGAPRSSETAVTAFLDGLEVLWGAETWYWPAIPTRAAKMGVRTVLYAMSELHASRELVHRADVVWRPTTWAPTEWWANVPVVAPGVPMSQITPTVRGGRTPVTFLHVGAPAMEDRNGTDTFLEALEHVTVPSRAVIIGAEDRALTSRWSSEVYVEWHMPTARWQDLYAEGDLLVLPRRYAGLSLPALEAAGHGLGVLMTDLEPQRSWVGVDSVIPTCGRRVVPMRGGMFPVAELDPTDLARVLDSYARDPEKVAEAAARAHRWASALSWEFLAPIWRSELEAVLASV